MFRLSRIPDRIGIWKRWFPIVLKFITWRKIHTAGPGSDNIVSHGKVNTRNRTQSVIIEARTTNEQTPYHLPTTPAPLPPLLPSPTRAEVVIALYGSRNHGFLGPEFSSRNPNFHQLLESRIQVSLTKEYQESSTWNPESTTWNPQF